MAAVGSELNETLQTGAHGKVGKRGREWDLEGGMTQGKLPMEKQTPYKFSKVRQRVGKKAPALLWFL